MNSQIEICGCNSVLVDGCKKILEYNEVLVKVKTWEMIVNIWGNSLTVSDFGNGYISIHGKIKTVELEENR